MFFRNAIVWKAVIISSSITLIPCICSIVSSVFRALLNRICGGNTGYICLVNFNFYRIKFWMSHQMFNIVYSLTLWINFIEWDSPMICFVSVHSVHLSSHWDCINDICVDISKSSSRLISIFSSFCFFSNHSFRCSFRFLNRADSFGLSNPFDFLSNVDLIQPFVQWSWMLCFPCSFCSKTTSSHSFPGISMWNFTGSPSGWYRRIKSFRHHLCHPISSSFLCSFISNEWRCSSIYSSSSDVTVRHFLFSILFRICCVIHIVSILCHINNKNKKMLFMKRNSTERKWENENSWWWWWNSLWNDSELNKDVFVTVFLRVFDWRWCMSQPVAIYHDEWCCMKLVISDEKRIKHCVSWVKTKWKRELHMRLLFR